MIERKDKEWFYDACIEHWNDIAENNHRNKYRSKIYDKYEPDSGCFSCHYFTNLNIKKDMDNLCIGCPFVQFNKKMFQPCFSKNSPYFLWIVSEDGQEHAIAIAQLFIDNHPDNEGGNK